MTIPRSDFRTHLELARAAERLGYWRHARVSYALAAEKAREFCPPTIDRPMPEAAMLVLNSLGEVWFEAEAEFIRKYADGPIFKPARLVPESPEWWAAFGAGLRDRFPSIFNA